MGEKVHFDGQSIALAPLFIEDLLLDAERADQVWAAWAVGQSNDFLAAQAWYRVILTDTHDIWR